MHIFPGRMHAARQISIAAGLVALSSASLAFDSLPEASDPQIQRLAVVFDFDTDSCYPSPAISPSGAVNPGIGVNEYDPSFVKGCRDPRQLIQSNTYHRRAAITRNGVVYEVWMYALYFMKDKDLPTHQREGGLGHRHDWEFGLVWTTNGKPTHASYSAHGNVTTKPFRELSFDGWCPECVKIVYHKDSVTTHTMRFAGKDEPPENDQHRWLTPAVVDWNRMPAALRDVLNAHSFGAGNCSVNDYNFPEEVGKSPPSDYPGRDEWRAAARKQLRPADIGRYRWAAN